MSEAVLRIDREPRGRSIPHGRTSVIALLAILAELAFSSIALAQNAPPLRRISPETVPDYRGAAASPADDPPVTMPTGERPFGSCERGMARLVWLRCLKATSEMTDQKVNETAGLVQQKLDAKAGAASGRKRFWSRALEQSQELWRGLRNHECQQLASAEESLVADVYEARLLCLLRSDLQRVSDLQSRYKL